METPNKTEMTKNPQVTKMVAPPKKVKVQALRTIRIGNSEIAEGQEVEVTEDEAKELCKFYKGQYSFGGERGIHDADRHKIAKAKLVG